MIGSGIFIVSADMARTLGSPGWLLVAWLITGFMTVTGALNFGELAAMMPKAGGTYVYLREAYNPLIGFLYGWTLFMVIQTGTIAAVAMAFGKFFGVIVPWINESNILMRLGPVKFSSVHLVAIGSLALLTWINSRGIRTGKHVQNTFTFTKVLILILLLLAGFIFAGSDGMRANSEYFWEAASIDKATGVVTPITGGMILVALAMAMVGSLFTCDAWSNVTFASAEVVNPKRTLLSASSGEPSSPSPFSFLPILFTSRCFRFAVCLMVQQPSREEWPLPPATGWVLQPSHQYLAIMQE